jgi:hypothetical protein
MSKDLDVLNIPPGSWADVGEELLFDWRHLIEGLDHKAQVLAKCDFKTLYARWKQAGSPTLSDYGLSWVILPSEGRHEGVAVINDCRHAKRFQIYVNIKHFKADGRVRLYWQMLACVLAYDVGLEKVKKEK